MKIKMFLFVFAVCIAALRVNGFAEDQAATPAPSGAGNAATVTPVTPVQSAITEQTNTPQASPDSNIIRKKSYEFNEPSDAVSKKEAEKLELKRLKAAKKAAEKLEKEKKKAEKLEAERLKVERKKQIAAAPQAASATYEQQAKTATRVRSMNQTSGRIARYMAEAKEYYVAGDLKKAQESADKAFKADPNNKDTIIFRNKIAALIIRMAEVKKDFSEQCYYRGAYFYKSGNILDALLFMEKSLKLNPQSEKAKTLRDTINEANEKMISNMGKDDGKKLGNAINSFVKEDYSKSTKIFRKLQAYYPEVTDFLAVALSHEGDESNKARSMEYVSEAADNIKHERYSKAQENLYLALEMDRENIDAMVLYEQVRPELDMFSSVVTGAYHSGQTPTEFNIEQNPNMDKNPVAR